MRACMGHASISTTQKYLTVEDSEIMTVIMKIGQDLRDAEGDVSRRRTEPQIGIN
jgi:hypothetical protein